MAIRIKRSSGSSAPSSLVGGQLAYTEGNGTLYVGKIDGTVLAIGGNADHVKVAGIEAGAQVNTVTSVAGQTGAVTLDSGDITDFNTAADARVAAAVLNDLSDVVISSVANGQMLAWDNATSKWVNTAPSGGVTAFTQLNDVPSSYTGQGLKFVRVNSGGTALEFVADLDDGTF